MDTFGLTKEEVKEMYINEYHTEEILKKNAEEYLAARDK